jgi:hypothetical protein
MSPFAALRTTHATGAIEPRPVPSWIRAAAVAIRRLTSAAREMHQMRIARFGPTAVSTMLLAAALGAPADGPRHRRHRGRPLRVEVGFQNEPAYLGQPNALFVKVSRYAAPTAPSRSTAWPAP